MRYNGVNSILKRNISMTPMYRLKPQFDELKVLLGNSFEEIVLNKSEYKEVIVNFCGDNSEHINKGVRSDFIRLYRLQLNQENTTTLAFSFTYLQLEEKSQKINFSYSVGKEEKKFSNNVEMTIEECREHIKNINKNLNVIETLSNDDILKFVREEFLGKDYVLKIESKKKKFR